MEEKRVTELIDGAVARAENKLLTTLRTTEHEVLRQTRSELELFSRRLQSLSDDTDSKLKLEIDRLKTEVTHLSNDAASGMVQREVARRVRNLSYFVLGLTVFTGLGLITRQQWFPWIHDTLKSPQAVYRDLGDSFASMSLSDIRRVQSEMPAFIWSTLAAGNSDMYEQVFGSETFLNVLHRRVRNEIAQTFGTPEQPKRVHAGDVVDWGKTPLPVRVVQIGPTGAALTNCNRPIEQNQLQAIVVIPREWDRNSIAWLGCDTRFPAITKLRLTVPGAEADGVVLQGLQRNGATAQVEVRVTRAVAQTLGIEGPAAFSGSAAAKLAVSEAIE